MCDFEYDIDNDALNELNDDILELIARWCYGTQIKTAILALEYCDIDCEL